MNARRRTRAVVIGVAAITVTVVAATTAIGAANRGRQVTISAEPSSIQVVGLPCLPGEVEVRLTNTGRDDVIADLTLDGDDPIALSRQVFSSWLPAQDPDVTASAAVEVRVPRDTSPGSYEITLETGRSRLDVPVEVLPLPAKGDGDNLALGEQATASSTHGSFTVCGAVDGDADSEHWSTATGWNDATRAAFPDSYQVGFVEPATVGRVDVQTLDSARYPAATNGLRDWDVEVLAGDAWQVVASVRGNVAGRVSSSFTPVAAEAVRVVAFDSNDHAYSRIVELEVYSS